MRLKIIKQIKRRGQVLVFYALLMPLMFLFVGVGLDLGWYYLNVSRLQNATDAAALAGAQALVHENAAFADYFPSSLVSNKLPEDFDHYENVFKNTAINGVNRELAYYKTDDQTKGTLLDGRDVVEAYMRKNLEDAEVIETVDNWKIASAKDGWSISSADDDKKVSGNIALMYKRIDAKNDVYGPLYYVVSLEEKIRHFFLPGWFDAMNAPVTAVVMLLPHDRNLIVSMQQLERTMVIDNWEYANKYKGQDDVYAGKWNHYMAGNTGGNTGINYVNDNPYRTESITVKTTAVSRDGGQKTDANGGQFYSAKEVDSLNIDFQADVRIKSNAMFTTDWDLGMAIPNFSEYYHVENGRWGLGYGDDKRILFNV